MLFRALQIVCAASLISLSGCCTGEYLGGIGCCGCGNENAITLDGNPVPGNGDCCEHWNEGWCAQRTNYRHACGTVNYWAFNTNSDYPPYEQFYCDQWPRATYQIGKKFDEHILNYDWDDPFVQCCEPCCHTPRCTMRYVEPCKRNRCCCNQCASSCDTFEPYYTGQSYDVAPAPCAPCGSR